MSVAQDLNHLPIEQNTRQALLSVIRDEKHLPAEAVVTLIVARGPLPLFVTAHTSI